MPEIRVPSRSSALLAACGLTLAAASAVVGQSEPFPAVLELSDLDGVIGFRMDGVEATDESGHSVASTGDINGDGIDDFIVGAVYVDVGSLLTAGAAYVVFGRPASDPFSGTWTLDQLDGTNGLRLDGAEWGANTGWSAAAAGDLNGDGISDLVVSAWDAGDDAGSAYVVFGRPRGVGFPAALSLGDLDGTNGFQIPGLDAGDRNGFSVAPAGDVNGDGRDDIIISAPNAAPGGRALAGECYVVFGRARGTAFPALLSLDDLNGTNGFRLEGIGEGDHTGTSVASAGDINGDSVGDLIVGAVTASPQDRDFAGSSYIVFGRTGGTAFPATLSLASLDGTNGFRFDGLEDGDHCGVSVSSAGDVNGDGNDDLIIGADLADAGDVFGPGVAYVVFGRDSGSSFPAVLWPPDLDGDTGFRIDGARGGDHAGSSVASAGDVNGDGVSDLLIGAMNAEPAGRFRAGECYLVFGRETGFAPTMQLSSLDGRNGVRIRGISERDHLGRALAPAGDVNADGISDVILGAGFADPRGRIQAGESYVIFGRGKPCPPDLDGDGELTIFDFLAFQNAFDDMDPVADFDGDGEFTIFDFLAFQNAFDAGCP